MQLNIKKGVNLNLAGALPPQAYDSIKAIDVDTVAISPDDFPGLRPRLIVKPGQIVAKGQGIICDKDHEDTMLVSPVAGEVVDVVRGERRKILRVVIRASHEQNPPAVSYKDAVDNATTDRSHALSLLGRSGMLAKMRQRPYDIIPTADTLLRDIFVTAIDTAPLSPSLAKILALMPSARDTLVAAIRLLATLTAGKIYISVGNDWLLGDIPGATMVHVKGNHPAGNVGVQIANINPVNKGETVWTLDAITLYKIGALVLTGQYPATTTVALTGSEVASPGLVNTIEGAQIAPLLNGNIKPSQQNIRIISGNLFTGIAVPQDGFLRFPYRQLTVIPEGDDKDDFMGWASLSPSKMSTSRSFPGHFLKKIFSPDARLHGGRRAMIMSGDIDKYLPMDIMGEYLIKAILANDIDAMEKLGIYEVAPEDFALAEYADVSKMPLQQIVRDGLDYMRSQV